LQTIRRAVLTLAALLSLAPQAASATTVWTSVSSEKVRPDAAARDDKAAAMAAAKNEFEAFQVVVTGPASHVSAEVSDLRGPGTIGGVKLYREELINLAHPSAADGATGRFPDALVPDVDDVVGEKRNAFPFDVPAGESRAIWVEVHVPADAAAGQYQGTVTVHAAEGDATVPVTLTVWDFALPSTSSLKTAFKMTYGGIPNAHHASGEALTQLRQRYATLALDHRISISDVWEDGQQSSWQHVDAAYGPLLDGTATTQLKGAKLTALESGAGLTDTSALADWAGHARAHGWFDRLFQYTCDEPPLTCQWSDVQTRAQAAKRADPSFRTLVTTAMSDAQSHGLTDSIDIMVPVINSMDDRPTSAYGWSAGGETRSQYDGFLQKSSEKELWLYQSCMSHGCGGTVDIGNPSSGDMYYTGWPSYMIDASAVRNRAMEWYSFRYNATGELYFETTQAYYDLDPWSSQWEFTGNGDGTLFYPGTTGRIGGHTDIPVISIRMKMIREGMEDFEYLKLLSDLGGGDDAKQIAQQLFPDAWKADAKKEDLMAAREAIARKILQRQGKPVPAAGVSAPAASVQAMAPAVAGGGCGSTGSGAGVLALLLAPLGLVWRRARRG
jgi:hypothetical protein